MFRSLRSQLLGWVLLPISAAILAGAWVAYENAAQTATVVQDQLLLGSARSIAEQVRFEDGSFQHQIPPAALELFQSSLPDRVYYRVTTGTGQLLAGYTALSAPPTHTPSGTPYFFSSFMHDMPVRTVALWQPVIGVPSAKPVMVEVAQTMHAHSDLTSRLWWQAMSQQIVVLGMLALLIVLGVHRGLRPVLQLRNLMRDRNPGATNAIELNSAPTELQPLVDSINAYAQRLQAHAHAHDVFLQNAAHQLRTPLTVLQTQLTFAERSQAAEERASSLAGARTTLQHASRLVNQLLALSASEISGALTLADASTDVSSTVQSVFEKLALFAYGKEIALAFEAATPTPLHVGAMALHEILINLVDNAIRYTPSGGAVTVRYLHRDGEPCLEVEDNGPGIANELREKVFERFYRINNRTSDGSGLGLAIVRQFADQLGARVSLHTPQSRQGLLVRLTDLNPLFLRHPGLC